MSTAKDFQIKEWDESYVNQDNFIFYPKEEVVKFLNRFIRRRTGVNAFIDKLSFEHEVRGLDYGCGIGRQTMLMREFGAHPVGIDISAKAIETAKALAKASEFPEVESSFRVTDTTAIPFEDQHFDFSICESVLDSMYFQTAKEIMNELGRVSKEYIFFSVISGKSGGRGIEYAMEEKVETQHEMGTIQSYFNWQKVQDLIADIPFDVHWSHLISEEGVTDAFNNSRFYVVLKRKN